MPLDPTEDVENVSLSPEDERQSRQLYYMLALLLKGTAQSAVRLTRSGEGLLLYREAARNYDPRVRSRSTLLMSSVLSYSMEGTAIRVSLQNFEQPLWIMSAFQENGLMTTPKLG